MQRNDHQIVWPDLKCSEILKWKNSKCHRKADAGRPPGPSHPNTRTTASQGITESPLQHDQLRPLAFGQGCPQRTQTYSFLLPAEFRQIFETNVMVSPARWHWGKPSCDPPQFPPFSFSPQQRPRTSAPGHQLTPATLLIHSLQNRLEAGTMEVRSSVWNLDRHWINVTVTNFLRENTENCTQIWSCLGIVVHWPC